MTSCHIFVLPPSQLALGVTCGPVVGFPGSWVAFISLPSPAALWRNCLTSLDSSEQSLHFHKLYCQLIWRLVLLRALQRFALPERSPVSTQSAPHGLRPFQRVSAYVCLICLGMHVHEVMFLCTHCLHMHLCVH